MKKILLILMAAMGAVTASAQSQAAYFMEGSTFRSQMNPAQAPRRGYFNIPVVGGIHIGTMSNLAFKDVLFPYNGGLVSLLDKHIPADRALAGLKTNNRLTMDTRINILGFGAYTRNNRTFWSFDLNTRVESEVNAPYALFDFMKNAPAQTTVENLSVLTRGYVEAAFGYSFRVTDDIYLGARGKFIVGGMRTRMTIDRMDIDLLENIWSLNGVGTLESSGLTPEVKRREDGSEYYGFKNLKPKWKMPAGYGFGIDVGVTWDLLDNLQLSLAANDLGFIAWRKDASIRGRLARTTGFNGVEIEGGQVVQEDPFDFDTMLQFDKENVDKGVTQSLKSSIVAGGEYTLWKGQRGKELGLGLLYDLQLWPSKTYHNLTIAANYTPIEWCTIGANYSMLNGRGKTVWFALNLCPRWINFFIATDVLVGKHTPDYFLPINRASINVTFGLGIPIGRDSHRHKSRVHPETVVEIVEVQ